MKHKDSHRAVRRQQRGATRGSSEVNKSDSGGRVRGSRLPEDEAASSAQSKAVTPHSVSEPLQKRCHPESAPEEGNLIWPKTPRFCARLEPQDLAELKSHGHHALLQPCSYPSKDVFQVLLDNMPEKGRLSSSQRRAIDEAKRLSANHFSRCRKVYKSTSSLVEAYLPIFDDLFFFGTLKGHTTVSWKPAEEWTWEKPILVDGYLPEQSPGFVGFSVTKSKGEKFRPKNFITIRHDTNSPPCHEDYVLDDLGILLHEMLHGFTELFECKLLGKHPKKCRRECIRLHGLKGHPPEFYEVCNAIEVAAAKLIGLPLLLNADRWNRDEGLSRDDLINPELDPYTARRTFVHPENKGLEIYEEYKRRSELKHDLQWWDTNRVVEELTALPKAFDSDCWQFVPEDLILELFIRRHGIDGNFIFAFFSGDEVDFWLRHCKKSDLVEHDHAIAAIKVRLEKLKCGKVAKSWLSFSRTKFRNACRGKRRYGRPNYSRWKINWDALKVEECAVYERYGKATKGLGQK